MRPPDDDSAPTSKGDLRRREIVRAAVECLGDDGWPGLTHRRVAQQAGANPGLLHYYFGNLAGLRREVARHVSADLLGPAVHALRRCADTEQLVDACVEELVRTEAEPRRTRALVQVMVGTAYYPEVADVVRTHLSRARDALATCLTRLDERWTREQAEASASVLVSVLDGLSLHALADPESPLAGRSDRLRATLRSILTPPG